METNKLTEANQRATQSAKGGQRIHYGSISASFAPGSSYPPSSRKPASVAAYGSCNVSALDVTKLAGAAKTPTSLLERLARRIPCLGIIFALCASFFLGSAGMLVKMTRSVHGVQVAVFRASIQAIIYGAIIAFRKMPLRPEEGELGPVLGRTMLGSASITLSYFALKLIPLGDATTIRFSLPVWTLIISYFFLQESCSLFKIGAVLASISGVVLIAKPEACFHLWQLIWSCLSSSPAPMFDVETMINGNNDEPLEPVVREDLEGGQLEGCLLALCSSVCLAMSLVTLRLCKKTAQEITIFWLSIGSICLGSILLATINEWRFPDNLMDVLFILLNGICGSIGQWFITSALKVEESGIISLARTFDIQVAFFYSAFLLKEQIRLTSICGSILVSCAVLAVAVPELTRLRAKRACVGPASVRQ